MSNNSSIESCNAQVFSAENYIKQRPYEKTYWYTHKQDFAVEVYRLEYVILEETLIPIIEEAF